MRRCMHNMHPMEKKSPQRKMTYGANNFPLNFSSNSNWCFHVPENSRPPFAPPSLKVICSVSSKHHSWLVDPNESVQMICGTIVPQRRQRTETGKERRRRRGKRREGGDVKGDIMSLSPCIPPPAHNAHFSPFSQQIRFSSVGQPPPTKANEREMRERRQTRGRARVRGAVGGWVGRICTVTFFWSNLTDES